MTVKAVTPQVPALGGGLQFWRDLDGVDLEMDSRWDEVDPGPFYPDPRLDDFHQGRYVRRTRGATRRVEPSLLNEHAGQRVGLNSRPACSPTFPSSGAPSGAGEPAVPSGDGPAGSPLVPGGDPLSSIAAGHRDPLDERGARQSPGAS